jgi:hypothetical protein
MRDMSVRPFEFGVAPRFADEAKPRGIGAKIRQSHTDIVQ